MKTQRVLRSSLCLCALLSLASCGLFQHKPTPVVTRTEIVTVSVPAYKPLPRELTSPLSQPLPPSTDCVDAAGKPAVCVLDALSTIPVYQMLLDVCNADRARAALFGVTDGQ